MGDNVAPAAKQAIIDPSPKAQNKPRTKDDESDFMDDCIAQLTDGGLMDDDDAEMVCQMLWDEGGGD
jgi:hypothetical protein